MDKVPGAQGQGITVAVLDSGITESDDLRNPDGTSRIISDVAFSKSMSALNTTEAESYTAMSGATTMVQPLVSTTTATGCNTTILISGMVLQRFRLM